MNNDAAESLLVVNFFWCLGGYVLLNPGNKFSRCICHLHDLENLQAPRYDIKKVSKFLRIGFLGTGVSVIPMTLVLAYPMELFDYIKYRHAFCAL